MEHGLHTLTQPAATPSPGFEHLSSSLRSISSRTPCSSVSPMSSGSPTRSPPPAQQPCEMPDVFEFVDVPIEAEGADGEFVMLDVVCPPPSPAGHAIEVSQSLDDNLDQDLRTLKDKAMAKSLRVAVSSDSSSDEYVPSNDPERKAKAVKPPNMSHRDTYLAQDSSGTTNSSSDEYIPSDDPDRRAKASNSANIRTFKGKGTGKSSSLRGRPKKTNKNLVPLYDGPKGKTPGTSKPGCIPIYKYGVERKRLEDPVKVACQFRDCDEVFTRTDNLIRHLRRHHDLRGEALEKMKNVYRGERSFTSKFHLAQPKCPN